MEALKLMDPSITLVLCGQDGVADWDRYVLQQCLRWTDMHSIHYYSRGKRYVLCSPWLSRLSVEKTTNVSRTSIR